MEFGTDDNDGLEALSVVEDEVRGIIRDMMNDREDPLTLPQSTPTFISAVVEYQGHVIYKSTFISQMIATPFLSKDRLTRVKNSIYFKNSNDYIFATASADTCLLGLGSDCTVYFVQRSTVCISSAVKAARKKTRSKQLRRGTPSNILQGVDEGTWFLRRV